MKRSRFTEEQITFALRLADRHAGGRRMATAWRVGGDFLHVEEEVRRFRGGVSCVSSSSLRTRMHACGASSRI